ncbi:hypothetical protein KAS42_02675 [bacterium]|nr:hypothetical protein [bacterium]
MKIKLLSVLLVAMMLFSVTSGIVAATQNSSNVITASDAGGGELTNQDIWIIVAIGAGIILLAVLLI